MSEEIGFENGRNSNFQGLVTLTLDPAIRHTVVHHSSTSTYIPNFIQIEETLCMDGRTDVWPDGHFSPYIIRSTFGSRPKNLIPSHANCMQHILRRWERQSDGTEYKKTLWRPGLCPGPCWGSLQRSCKSPGWWGGAGCPLSPPQESHPPLSALRASPFLPHSKISSNAVDRTNTTETKT